MESLGMLTLDNNSGGVAKTTAQQEADKLEAIDLDKFGQIPEIKFWMDECKSRGITAGTIQSYFNNVKRIFKVNPTNPKYVVASRANALEFWKNYLLKIREQTGKLKASQPDRVAFKNLIDSFGISFGHKMGAKHGLGSEHDSYKKYAGVNIVKFIPRLSEDMLANKEFDTYLWFRLGLRTGARSSAIASMTWDRIYFDNKDAAGNPLFKLEQHETKDKQGHYHLGINGDWKVKFPNGEIKELLLEWKAAHPEFRRFVFFEDAGQDTLNKAKARCIHQKYATRLATYYKSILDELDPLTKEYLLKRPDHMMRHNFAQMCKDAGMTDEEISIAGGWRGTQTIGWYSAIAAEKQQAIHQKAAEMKI